MARNIYPTCDKKEGGIFISVVRPVQAIDFKIKKKDRERSDASFSPLKSEMLRAAGNAITFNPFINERGDTVELVDLLLPVDAETGKVGDPKVRVKVDLRVKKRPQKLSAKNFFFPHKHFLRVSGVIDLQIVVPMDMVTEDLE